MKRYICVDCGWIGNNPFIAPSVYEEFAPECPECGSHVERFLEFGICVVCGCEGVGNNPLCPDCQRMMLEVKDASR